jgi:hypothetical protein
MAQPDYYLDMKQFFCGPAGIPLEKTETSDRIIKELWSSLGVCHSFFMERF